VSRIAFGLEWHRSRLLVGGLALIGAIYAGFISLFYTNVVANAAAFQDVLDLYPKELLQAFGVSGDLAAPGVYLGGNVFTFLWPLLAAIGAITLATRVAGDADRGFLDILLTTPLPRLRHLAISIGMQVLALIAVATAMILGILLGDLVIAPSFPTDRLLASIVLCVAFGMAVAGPATFLAVLLLDRGRAAGLVAGGLVVMYLVNVIAQLAPASGALAAISFFRYFTVREFIDGGAYPVANTVVLAGTGLVGWALALLVFRRRDVAA
jgi:ABC-2 type transport system permease protein